MKKVIIMGAAGRDFHNFNTLFRDNKDYKVVCFTATQIPYIEKRLYPKALAGRLYPRGIPIHPDSQLNKLIQKHKIDEVYLSYSDLSHQYVMEKASDVMSAGAKFCLVSPRQTQLSSKRKVISICAVRTGSGKSQTTRKIAEHLKKKNICFAVVRHPMPYGNLAAQACQMFQTYDDLKSQNCTIEEREEYEAYVSQGIPVFAGVDYHQVLKMAERHADVILWDGGNNDFSFFKPDLEIVVADPLRPGDELTYYPGAVNSRTADIVIINKVNSAKKSDVKLVQENIKSVNKKAKVILADSTIKVDNLQLIKNKRVLVIEDGPTLTHGNMTFGAATVAAKKFKAKIVDPVPYAVGSIKEAYKKYPNLKNIVPALGYSRKQIKDLEKTINKAKCDAVIIGTPIDLGKLININKPYTRVFYDLTERALLRHVDKILK